MSYKLPIIVSLIILNYLGHVHPKTSSISQIQLTIKRLRDRTPSL
jgi:hypothetical protein